MKKLFTLLALLGTTGSLSAQYRLDLRDVSIPEIRYFQMGDPGPAGREIRINNLYLEEGGVPQLPVMGEFHYSRMDHRYWKDALLKMKASGINIVATYCLWSLHEEFEGQLSWEGNLNLRRFIELCREVGLKVHLRIGPYCNAEIRHGALPDWLVQNLHLKPRTNDPLYLRYVERWYRAVYDQARGLLYKDGGPVIAVQLENEYVTPGMVVDHMMNLKRMAVKIGFDVPVYTMTHWMGSEYPKGEIVPYAGYYIETPWTATGKEEIPTSDFEFFSYNRLSDNIGTDIIKIDGEVESLSGEANDSPYFTCEVGVGTTAFYGRRAVVPQEMAGENINLRLGCGVNLMGYYMYVGGSNPVGRAHTNQSSGPRVNYDYQAPIREFGTLGRVMPETKKYNYFMNDFGSSLAPAVAYLPTSKQDTANLQWAVRAHGNSGYLFCSNRLYKHDRNDYPNVQFTLVLEGERLTLPRQKSTVRNGAYFLWPFNQTFGGVTVRYATAQPICRMDDHGTETVFLFEDDAIPAEYLLAAEGIRQVSVTHGQCRKERNGYFIDQLEAGRECIISIEKNDGTTVRLVTLTEPESDLLWKGKRNGSDFVALTPASLIYDDRAITLISEEPTTELWLYRNGAFEHSRFQESPTELTATVRQLSPMSGAERIAPVAGNCLNREFALHNLSTIERAYLRYTDDTPATFRINDQTIESQSVTGYRLANLTPLLTLGTNRIEATLDDPSRGLAAEIEILMKNGERFVWNTDGTWTGDDQQTPANCLSDKRLPAAYAPEEHLALYEVYTPTVLHDDRETRMYLSYLGDVANAYLNGQLVGDSFFDGTEWILSLSRLKSGTSATPFTIRIDGLKSADAPIYFEKNVDPSQCVDPRISSVRINREHRFTVQ